MMQQAMSTDTFPDELQLEDMRNKHVFSQSHLLQSSLAFDSPTEAKDMHIPLSKPRPYPLFHPAIAQHRKQYFTFYFVYAALLIILMWALLPIYWASLAYNTQLSDHLQVFVIDHDQSTVGNGVVAAVQQAINQRGTVSTLGWTILPSNDTSLPTNDDVFDAIADEQAWAAVLIQAAATNSVISSFTSSSSQNSPVINVYYNEARNEIAASTYIVPILNSVLVPVTASLYSNLTSQFLASNANNQTEIQAFSAALARQGSTAGLTFNLINVRPYTTPVVLALTEVGLILIVIFSFILTMANSALRPMLSPHLSLSSYVLLRVFTPLLAYIPLSLSFATISLAFRVPFNAKYTEAQGFGLFWILCYIIMGGVGMATEFAIGALTIRFAPFFLVTLIISNVSITSTPLEIQPGVFRYGRGFPFFNASQAFRTIVFDTKSHLSTNVPVLIGWLLISMLTVAVSTWIIEGRNRRLGIVEAPH
ncbi:hypothetical protein SERLA73DRAFT_178650 [Serpula lacrymans var. lacrymans S7.3]|uniref:DUF3533 domain-containing protein n=2 Tax=Serpula lacrymans var. lacrymans TaxID=341189 RepID=F8PSC9_SERL3|nr:uncharacterized protein SERLADRAFT_463212 [Serpula lacrymans var. lacrymans S7.9]EGO00742.1 hypothetical protein SERLA73DRAFT_178650 [Serpula lacrymans var. lacrymans S7.3]EGO26307.1 hypothetical protein SERLADRAFT_463212 [Serpula lacrymans var. lacrymans S7.9]